MVPDTEACRDAGDGGRAGRGHHREPHRVLPSGAELAFLSRATTRGQYQRGTERAGVEAVSELRAGKQSVKREYV